MTASSAAADPLALAAHNGRRDPAGAYYRRLQQMVELGQGGTEAIVMAEQPAGVPVGSRYLFDADGSLVDQRAEDAVPELVARLLVPVQQRPRPSVHQGIAYLPFLPRITLFIVGGGHVGQAVARLASEVDFDIWVLDDRERYASRQRFPTARRILVGDIGAKLKELAPCDLTPSTYCLIITRGHNHDEEALYHLANTPAGYVGMIGSKRKIKLIYEDLLARGITEQALARVYAPLGFAIGSQTVPEIAISIVAELIACRNLGATIAAARVRVKAS
jgi:xanthine dehydrogenase accessory factor